MDMADISCEGGVPPEAGGGDSDVVLSNTEIAIAFQVILDSLGKLQFSMLRMNLRIGKTDEVIDLMLLGLKLHRERVKRLQGRFEEADRKLEHKRAKGEGEIVQDLEDQMYEYNTQEDYMAKLQKRLFELERAVAAEEKIEKVLKNDRHRNAPLGLLTPKKPNLPTKWNSMEFMLKSNDRYSFTRNTGGHQERRKLYNVLNRKLPVSRKAVQAFKQHVFNDEYEKAFILDKHKQEQVSDNMTKSRSQDYHKEIPIFKHRTTSFDNKSPPPLKQKHFDGIQILKTPISCKESLSLKNRRFFDGKFKPLTLPKQKQDHDDVAHKQKLLISRKEAQSFTQKLNSKDQDKHIVPKEQKQEQSSDNIQNQGMHISPKDLQMFKQKIVSEANYQCLTVKQKKEQQADNLAQPNFSVPRKETQILKPKVIYDEKVKCFSPIKQKKEQQIHSMTLPKMQTSRKETKRILASEEKNKHLGAEKQNQEHNSDPKKQRMLTSSNESNQILQQTTTPSNVENEHETQDKDCLENQLESIQKRINLFGKKQFQTTQNIENVNQLHTYQAREQSAVLFSNGSVRNQRLSIPRIVLSSSEISVTSSNLYSNNPVSEQDSTRNGDTQNQEVHRSMIMEIPERALTSHEMRAVAQLFRQNDNEQTHKLNSVRNVLNILEKMVISVLVDTPKPEGSQQLQIQDGVLEKQESQITKKMEDISDDSTDTDELDKHTNQEIVRQEYNEQILKSENRERSYSPRTMLKMFENAITDNESFDKTERDEIDLLENEKLKTEETLDATRETCNQAIKLLVELPNPICVPEEKTPSDSQISSASSVVATATFTVEHPTQALTQHQHQATPVGSSARPTLSSMHQFFLRRLRRLKVSRSVSHTSNKLVPSNHLGQQLMKATKDGRLSEVRRLLKQGAEPNFLNRSRWTPLHVAARKGHPEIISALLKRGASVNARTSYGLTALHIAAYNDNTGRCVANLIKAGAHLNSSNKFGRTPLHVACLSGNVAAVYRLLEGGASKTLRNDAGKLPLDVAKNDTIRQLLSQEKTKKK